MGRGWFGVVKFRIAKFIQPEKNCGDRAVLVAISIPIFTSQLEKSREAVDLANIRAAYAEVMTTALTGDKKNSGNVKYDNASNTYTYTVTLKQTKDDWQTTMTDVEIGGVASTAFVNTPKANGTATVSYKEGTATTDGTVTITFVQ